MQDVTQITFDRLADEREQVAEVISTAREGMPDGGIDPTELADHAWKQWLEATSFLQELGASPRALQDATNIVYEARTQERDRQTA